MDLFFHNKLTKIKCFFPLLLLIISSFSKAQTSAVDQHPAARYFQAIELYQSGAYELALPIFQEIYFADFADEILPFSSKSRNCLFFLYDCLLRLDKGHVTGAAKAFIEAEDPVIRKNLLSYQLAAYYFRRGDYKTRWNMMPVPA